ncbi:MAG: hypothetical protein NTW19_18270 [Planctomycetota bacterium]|nr:hypothetical protein [Planctomycetota bacterium]
MRSPIGVGVAACCLVGALASFYFTSSGSAFPAYSNPQWYYDLNNGEVFVSSDVCPPIPTKSGPHDGAPAGVHAVLFSCTDCSDEKARFVGYIETVDAEFRASIPPGQLNGWYNPLAGGSDSILAATRIRRPDAGDWVAADSEEAAALTESINQKCTGDQTLIRCPAPAPGVVH